MENKTKGLEFWEQPEQLFLIRFYARRFNSLKRIAENMGIDRVTLWRWQKDSPLIRETLINNKWARIAEIEDLLFEKAKEGNPWAISRYLRAFGGRNHSLRPPGYYDDYDVGLISEVLSETQPEPEEEKPKGCGFPEEMTKNATGEIRKIVYKYSTT